MSNSKLSKIQMESDDDLSSAPDTDSEAESAVTVETNPADSLYEVGEYECLNPKLGLMADAIKHAVWRDSRRQGPGYRDDGWLGWHYKVMWRGYLKTLSETEEPVTVFETPTYYDSDLEEEVQDLEYTREGDMVVQFWKAFDTRHLPHLKLKGNQREPGDPGPTLRSPYVFECPNEQMRKWLNETNGKRTFGIWLNRQAWERQHPDEPTIKRYSDYYVYKKRQQKIRAEKKYVGGSDVLLPKKAKKDSSSRNGKEDRDKGKQNEAEKQKEENKGRGKEKEKVEGKGKGTEKEVDKVKPSSENKEKQRSIKAKSVEDAAEQPENSSRKRKFRTGSKIRSPEPAGSQQSSGGIRYLEPSSKPNSTKSSLAREIPIVPTSPLTIQDAPSEDDEMEVDSIAVDQFLRKSPSASSLGSALDSDDEDRPPQKVSKPSNPSPSAPAPVKTTAKAAPSAKAEDLAALFPSPPRKLSPAEKTVRLEGLGKIKKRDLNTVPVPQDIRAPTPQFGEPESGIFGPPSPAFTAAPPPAPAVKVLPPTPLPPKPRLQSVSRAASLASSAPPAPPSSLLKSTLASLGAAAKKAPIEDVPVGSIVQPLTTSSTPQSPIPHVHQPTGNDTDQGPMTTSSSLPTKSVALKEKQEIVQRPKYQQPVKVKLIDNDAPLPSRPRTAAPLRSAVSHQPRTGPRDRHSPYGGGLSPLQGGSTPYQSFPSHPSASWAYVPRESRPAASSSKPGAHPQPALIPFHHTNSYAPRQVGPLHEQNTSFGAARQQVPYPLPPQHAPPPLPPASTHPPHTPSFDPRLASMVSPQQPYSSALAGPSVLQHTYNPAGDLRLRNPASVGRPPTPLSVQSAGPTPNTHGHMSPYPLYGKSPRSPGSVTRKTSAPSSSVQNHQSLCHISTILPAKSDPLSYISFEVGLLRGAASSSSDFIRTFLGPLNGNPKSLVMEEVDDICLKGCTSFGAGIVEWARATVIENGRTGKAEWESLRNRANRERKAYVTYTELRGQKQITAHFALVLASPDSVDMSSIGLGLWIFDEIKLALFVFALPLGSGSITTPCLPNPVRPDFSEPLDQKPMVTPPEMSLLESYGFDHDFMSSMRNRTAIKYPGAEGPADVLDEVITQRLKTAGVQPTADLPENLFVLNQKFGKALRSSTVRSVLSRRTAIYAFGPSLQLHPNQWKRQRIWQRGGLVTFSPTFILRSPEKFSEIMKTIRTVDTWAAYVLPSVIEWCHTSWSEPARCPEPMKAFEALSKSLFLDENLLRLSGSYAPAGGGLAVSCAPPNIHDFDGCHRWMDWLRKVADERSYDNLTGLCFGVQPRDFTRPMGESKPLELDLVDIEQSQLDDLVAMRMRPHLLPYRRYLYIGEVSLDSKSKSKFENVIELVAPDNFAAIISGAV